jgi:hypothetical protein
MKRRLFAAVAVLAASAAIAAAALAVDRNPNTLRAAMTGAAEPQGSGDPNGVGTATFNLNGRRHRICFKLTFRRIGPPFAGHIHTGRRGVSGDVLVPLFEGTRTRTSPIQGCASNVAGDTIRDIREHPNRFYVNLHNATYPAGAIRGQLKQR